MTEPTPEFPTRLECRPDAGFVEWLGKADGTIAVTTYQAGKLVLIGWDGAQVTMLPRDFDRPMGMAVEGQRILLATRHEVILLANAPLLAPEYKQDEPGRYDALFLPRVRYWTGGLHTHDVGIGSDGPWIVATRFDCLARLSQIHNFVPAWKPPFVSDTMPEDRCHLNGLAMMDGHPGYVTCLGETNTPGGWREKKAEGGIVVDVADGSIRLRGLSMPHSPRWHSGKLWVLNSGRGELWQVDPETGTHAVVCALPGYLRGLAFVGSYALIGLCQVRERKVFGDNLPIRMLHPRLLCGVAVVDLQSGTMVGLLEFTEGCTELFEVAWLPRVRRAMVLNVAHPAQVEAFTAPAFSFWIRPDSHPVH